VTTVTEIEQSPTIVEIVTGGASTGVTVAQGDARWVRLSMANQPNGYAALDVTGHVDPDVLPGGSGGSVAGTHVQSAAATVWTVTHGLSFMPAGILVVLASGQEIQAGITRISATQFTVEFTTARTGTVYYS